MKKSIFFTLRAFFVLVIIPAVLIIAYTPQAIEAKTITVGIDGPPDYDYAGIQDGINAATSPDDIVEVDDGIYDLGQTTLNFAGNKQNKNVRITVKSKNGRANCIIKGSSSVIYFVNNEGVNSVLDGFKVIRDTKLSTYYPAIYCSTSSPTIINCLISNTLGLGVNCSTSSPHITNCTIENNSGSGIYCTESSAVISGCIIRNNGSSTTEMSGGGIYIKQPSYDSSQCVSINDCTIEENKAGLQGGGICCALGSVNIKNCKISENFSRLSGGGIFLGPAKGSILDCQITGNTTNSNGGGIYIRGENWGRFSGTISGCTISGNKAIGEGSSAAYGGGIYFTYFSGTISHCTISGNSVSSENEASGGGIYHGYFSGTIQDCTISGNLVSSNQNKASGGGVYLYNSPPDKGTFSDCTISENSVSSPSTTASNQASGGGIYFTSFYGEYIYEVFNCIINNNSANQGAGIYGYYTRAKITNCTVAGNTSVNCFAIVLFYSTMHFTNCILWDNTPTISLPGVGLTISYSDVNGGTGTNININPQFVNPATGDYRLGCGSPCVDAGNPDNTVAPATDRDGVTRPLDGNADGILRCDMGAYEFINQGNQEVCDGIDNDCDGKADEGFDFGSCTVGVGACKTDGFKVCKADGTGTECILIPGIPSTEICGDHIDNDCDGNTDEANEENTINCITYYKDTDKDTFGLTGDHKCFCGPQGDYSATQGGDCDDQDANRFPGNPEICDGKDNDCDKLIDEWLIKRVTVHGQ